MASVIANSTTTIEIRRTLFSRLANLRDPRHDRNWSDVIERLLSNDAEMYVKIISIDGFLADSSEHEVIFVLGDEPPRYYRYFNGKFEELDSLPKMKVEVQK